jgi:hypothetical protein
MHYARARVPLLDYPTQVSELEKIARLSPSSPVQREPPELADADAEATCLVCGARPARACTACGGVSYCGEAHQRVDARWHDLVCADLRAIAEDDVLAAKQPRSTLVDALIERIDRAQIDDLAGWNDLLEAEIVGARRRLLTDLGTRSLTLARVLADLDVPAARSGVLSIHVMAAAKREREVPPALWATLGRLFPGTRFELALVGPELDDSPSRIHRCCSVLAPGSMAGDSGASSVAPTSCSAITAGSTSTRPGKRRSSSCAARAYRS